jgi:hypothetical protein
LRVCSADELPGQMQVNMMILFFSDCKKESLRTMVSLEPLKGIC